MIWVVGSFEGKRAGGWVWQEIWAQGELGSEQRGVLGWGKGPPPQEHMCMTLKLECVAALRRALLHPQLGIEPVGRRYLFLTG